MSEAARREVNEELGISVEMQKLIGVYEDFVQEKGLTLHYVIVCYLALITGADEIRATDEVIDSVWIDPSNGRENAPRVIQMMLKEVATVAKRRHLWQERP
ncbi:MAG: NUDIX domain-containing protein [Thaumarchaeota archaeon]|nr:NUDIX domain-containing protein [Nitrososphaerota archaeon]